MAKNKARRAAQFGVTALFGTLGVALIASTVSRLPAQAPATSTPASRTAARPTPAKHPIPVASTQRAPQEPAPAPVAAAAPEDGPFVIKRVLDIPKPFNHGDSYWDDKGVPDGPVIITVDLVAQTLSAFRNGYEIGTAVILYGADRKPTPTGTFTITQKDADHISNLYDAPMPYMMRLTNDGVAIHGSPELHPSYATHGCVGLPIPFAKKLFAATKLGTRVIITRGKMIERGSRIIAA